MISDVLFDAGSEIDRYLEEFPWCYEGEMLEEIQDVRLRMRRLQAKLDMPPGLENIHEAN